MLELGVPPLQARIYFCFSKAYEFHFILAYFTDFTLQSIFIHIFLIFQEKDLEGKRPCPVCNQLRTAKDKTPDGQIHGVLGCSNKVWCPYADDLGILEVFEKEQKERMQAAWRRANLVKREKKQHVQS